LCSHGRGTRIAGHAAQQGYRRDSFGLATISSVMWPASRGDTTRLRPMGPGPASTRNPGAERGPNSGGGEESMQCWGEWSARKTLDSRIWAGARDGHSAERSVVSAQRSGLFPRCYARLEELRWRLNGLGLTNLLDRKKYRLCTRMGGKLDASSHCCAHACRGRRTGEEL